MSDLIDKLEPYDDYIAIEPIKEESTSSGIIIASMEDRGHPLKGRVLRVGKGAVDKDGSRIEIEAQPGDVVYYSRGTETELEEDLVFIKETKILVTVRGEEVIPYWDKVVIEMTSDSGENAAGVILLSDQEANYDKGTVLSVGSGFPQNGVRAPMELEPGMRVAFNQFEGVELDLGMDDMRRLYVTRENQVYGILT